MKKTILISLLCTLLAMPALAQPGYGYGHRPRVQTVGRHGNEYVAWHSYYLGFRVGLNASHVATDGLMLDGSGVKSGLNIGFAAGTQLTYRAPLFLETGLYYTQKGGKGGSGNDKITCELNYLEVPLLIKYKHFVGYQTSILRGEIQKALRLSKIDDVDAFAFLKDVRDHLGVAFAFLVTEMDAGFQKFGN